MDSDFKTAFAAQAAKVLSSDADDFTSLVHAAGLDPKTDFRRANLSGVDFAGADLKNFDFQGADLSNSNMSGAGNVEFANFNAAKVDGVVWPTLRYEPVYKEIAKIFRFFKIYKLDLIAFLEIWDMIVGQVSQTNQIPMLLNCAIDEISGYQTEEASWSGRIITFDPDRERSRYSFVISDYLPENDNGIIAAIKIMTAINDYELNYSIEE